MPVEVVVQNFIDGQFVEVKEFLESYDPSTGEVWAQIPDSGKIEVDKAVSAAKNAYQKLVLQAYSKQWRFKGAPPTTQTFLNFM